MSSVYQTTKATAVVDPVTGKAHNTNHPAGGGFFIKPDERGGTAFQGEPFSLEQVGNKVEFFTTGQKYYEDVAKAIEGAQKSVFITGWQLNFDAFLTPDKRLWDCLSKALSNNKDVRIYAMPWCSPKVPVDTFDLDAMFAVFLLNGGLEGPIRALCLPARQQSDMSMGGIGFSHHQKSVIIDNKIAYVGGIDIAYGRRDDERFTLKMEWRDGRERYNTCIPPLGVLAPREDRHYLGFMELFTCVLWEGDAISKLGRDYSAARANISETIDSAQSRAYDLLPDWLVSSVEAAGTAIDKAYKEAKKDINAYVMKTAAGMVDRAPGFFDNLPESLKLYIAYHRHVGGALISEPLAVIMNFLNGATLNDLPAPLWERMRNDFRLLCMRIYIKLLYLSDLQVERYSYLESRISEKTGRKYAMLPPGGAFLDGEKQPRMPWQDVHSRIEGPSVCDLSNNFVRRWNALQARLHREYTNPEIECPEWLDKLLGRVVGDSDYQALMKEIDTLKERVENEAKTLAKHKKDLEVFLKQAEQEAEELKRRAKIMLETLRGQAQAVRAQAGEVKKQLAVEFDGYKKKVMEKANALGIGGAVGAVGAAVGGAGSAFGTWLTKEVEAAKEKAHSIVDYLKQMVAACAKEPEPFYIDNALLPEPASVVAQREPSKGSCSVQVLRSAAAQMIQDEEAALDVLDATEMPGIAPWQEPGRRFGKREQTGRAKEETIPKQDNCQNAIVRIIHNAQHFLYIEGQFYQSEHGGYGRCDLKKHSGPMGWMVDLKRLPNYTKWAKRLRLDEAVKEKNLGLISSSGMAFVALEDPDFYHALKRILVGQGEIFGSNLTGRKNDKLKNQINKAMGERIGRAIMGGQHFHVYIVLPVHPEGTLDTINIMSQVFLTQQSLHFGEDSLINRIRRAIAAKRLMDGSRKVNAKGEKLTAEKAKEAAAKLSLAELEAKYEHDWKQYLTLLNLRNWDVIGGRPVTEQIYVHSKLVIADDRVAVLGSANINDRSLEGERDSELAVIIKDGTELKKPITGGAPQVVSKAIHELRVALWKKLFGLAGVDMGKIAPASSLAAVLEKPAHPDTWKAIQQVAEANAKAYEAAFPFIPRNESAFQDVNRPPVTEAEKKSAERVGKRGASIWPGWYYTNPYDHDVGTAEEGVDPKTASGPRIYHPFDRPFWALPGQAPESWSFKPNQTEREKGDPRLLPEIKEPKGIQGFITALPILWTAGENNLSEMNFDLLAGLMDFGGNGETVAMASATTTTTTPTPTPSA